LYFTNAFRRVGSRSFGKTSANPSPQALYQIPTENESVTNSAYALQRLFYLLQTSTEAVSTAELTRSFGWETRHVFEQQDLQEFLHKLIERMEEKMKGTAAENALPELFVGKTKTYVSCINVAYESSYIEDFWSIQLNVSGNKNIDESFRDYIKVGTMDGEYKYYTEGFGFQDAKKGVIFESFPQVLHIYLKRYEYDTNLDVMKKVNDRYEFPEAFDVSPYLSDEADRSEPYTYQLHGVLVHSGDLNAGHYYAFLKPTKDGTFYRYNDDKVTRATMREVLEESYGSAYMLVYIRQSRLGQVLLPVTKDDIPSHLRKFCLKY
jgi:ubiquitin carboxyl-terminal hydrolase 7